MACGDALYGNRHTHFCFPDPWVRWHAKTPDGYPPTHFCYPDPWVRWHAETPYGYPHLVIRRPQVRLTSRDQCGHLHPFQRCQHLLAETILVSQHMLILIQESGGRRKYPSGYPYEDNICWSWHKSQVAGRNTQVVICTKTTFVDPNPWVRWQQKYPSGYPYKDNIC